MSSSTSISSSISPQTNYQAIPGEPHDDHRIDIETNSSGFVRNILSGGFRIRGDKAVAEATIRNVAAFALRTCGNTIRDDEKEKLRALSSGTLSKAQVIYGKRFIERQPLITVVSNSFNHSDEDRIRITDIVEYSEAYGSTIKGFNLQAQVQGSTNTNIMVVSENAWNSINRYCDNYWKERCMIAEIKTCVIATGIISIISIGVISQYSE